jgi:hypothetical protein
VESDRDCRRRCRSLASSLGHVSRIYEHTEVSGHKHYEVGGTTGRSLAELERRLRARVESRVRRMQKALDDQIRSLPATPPTEAAAPSPRYCCPQCGKGGHCDEDGCCVACGRALVDVSSTVAPKKENDR